jgi:hypothetical protein
VGSAVEVAGGDVGGDGVGEDAFYPSDVDLSLRDFARGIFGGGADLFADGGGADVDVEAGEEEEGRGEAGGVAESIDAEIDVGGFVNRSGLGADREAGREDGGEIVEGLAGARGDDEGRDEGDFGTAMPAAEAEEGVGAHEAEELGVEGEIGADPGESVKSIVRGVAGRSSGGRRVSKRDEECGVAFEGEARHGDAVVEFGGGPLGLEGLRADGSEEDGVEMEGALRGAGDG